MRHRSHVNECLRKRCQDPFPSLEGKRAKAYVSRYSLPQHFTISPGLASSDSMMTWLHAGQLAVFNTVAASPLPSA